MIFTFEDRYKVPEIRIPNTETSDTSWDNLEEIAIIISIAIANTITIFLKMRLIQLF